MAGCALDPTAVTPALDAAETAADAAFEKKSLDTNRAGMQVLLRTLNELGLEYLRNVPDFEIRFGKLESVLAGLVKTQGAEYVEK